MALDFLFEPRRDISTMRWNSEIGRVHVWRGSRTCTMQIREEMKKETEMTYTSHSVRKLVGKGDCSQHRECGLRGEGECVDEVIQNMKPNEDVSDGSKRLRAYTAPAPVLEEGVAVHGSEAFKKN
jgi:hypothetical protein